MAEPELSQKAGISSAPIPRGLLVEPRDDQLSQNSCSRGAHSHHGNGQILAADLNANASSYGQPSFEVGGSHCRETALSYQRRMWRGGSTCSGRNFTSAETERWTSESWPLASLRCAVARKVMIEFVTSPSRPIAGALLWKGAS